MMKIQIFLIFLLPQPYYNTLTKNLVYTLRDTSSNKKTSDGIPIGTL